MSESDNPGRKRTIGNDPREPMVIVFFQHIPTNTCISRPLGFDIVNSLPHWIESNARQTFPCRASGCTPLALNPMTVALMDN